MCVGRQKRGNCVDVLLSSSTYIVSKTARQVSELFYSRVTPVTTVVRVHTFTCLSVTVRV